MVALLNKSIPDFERIFPLNVQNSPILNLLSEAGQKKKLLPEVLVIHILDTN